MMKWMFKKIWLGLLEALQQWLTSLTEYKPEGEQTPNDSRLRDSVKHGGTKPKQTVDKTETVKKQAHEILKGRR